MLAYSKTADQLRNHIRDSKHGDRLPGENELTQTLGVSRVTVRKALEILAAEGLVVKKAGKGTFVNKPQSNSQHMRIVCITYDYPLDGASDVSQMITGCLDQANKLGTRLHFLPAVKDISEVLSETRNYHADGILLIQPLPFQNRLLEALKGFNLPLMLVNRVDSSKIFSYVSTDHRKGTDNATEILLRKGHRRVGFAYLDESMSISGLRSKGYQDALKRHGLPCSEDAIMHFTRTKHFDPHIRTTDTNADTRLLTPIDSETIFANFNALLDNYRPTALMVVGRWCLSGVVLPGLRARGLRVPEDIEIATFDEVSDDCPEKPFIHTAIQPDRKEMGRLALEYLEKIVMGHSGRVEITIEPKIIEQNFANFSVSGRTFTFEKERSYAVQK